MKIYMILFLLLSFGVPGFATSDFQLQMQNINPAQVKQYKKMMQMQEMKQIFDLCTPLQQAIGMSKENQLMLRAVTGLPGMFSGNPISGLFDVMGALMQQQFSETDEVDEDYEQESPESNL